MIAAAVSFLAGVLFGLGLAVSQMTNPMKVLAFLDILGNWDPSLALVMAGAVGVAAIGFAQAKKRASPVLENEFQIPEARDLDMPLVLGAALFGIGWGLVGLCPGPAIAGLMAGKTESVIFVGAMLVGMLAHRLIQTVRR